MLELRLGLGLGLGLELAITKLSGWLGFWVYGLWFRV